MEQKKISGIDWVELHTLAVNELAPGKYGEYILEQQIGGTRQHSEIYDVKYYDMRVARLVTKPYSYILDQKSTIIKFENWVCYSENYISEIYRVLVALKLLFQGITRLDLYMDIQNVYTYIEPQTFINEYVRNNIIKTGKAKTKIIFNNEHDRIYDYVSWGKRTSDVMITMYNKSKEMQEAKAKSYIYDTWKKVGFNQNKDVYRIEVSMKAQSKEIQNIETGELIDFHSLEIIEPAIAKQLLATQLQKYFIFKKNTGLANMRREPALKIIDYEITNYTIKSKETASDSTRTMKIHIKRLHEELKEISEAHTTLKCSMKNYIEIMIERYNLAEWASRKLT